MILLDSKRTRFLSTFSIYISFFILSNVAESYPVKGSLSPRYQKYYKQPDVETTVIEVTAVPIEATTKEGIISSVWHKIKNIFSTDTETTTQSTQEETTAVKSRGGNIVQRKIRMVPPDFRKGNVNHDVRRWQSRSNNEEENSVDTFPVVEHHHFDPSIEKNIRKIMQRNTPIQVNFRMPKMISYNGKQFRYVPDELSARNNAMQNQIMRRSKRDVENVNPLHLYVEEFDQGESEDGRVKRFVDLPNKEIISVGSDPVENIDNENYIEELEKGEMPVDAPRVQTAIVQKSEPLESTTNESLQELTPIKIIEKN